MIDLAPAPTLSSWATDDYSGECHPDYPTYMRDMDFSPDGSYFVVVTTGGPGYGTTRLCDTAARWEWSAPGWAEALIPGRVRGYGTPEEVLR
ncbi:hypothetical protein GCM10010191_21600 [Actinomadura vinacea]|uniref:Uncharacterized protein n=1 Tax=Actinomadura vinacea TaxID=115336 RepID=A0ABN3IRE6_9ACTN